MAGSLKAVRERIRSVQNTQQITRAMKMVSAAKLRRAQQAIQRLRPFANKLDAILRNVLSNLEGDAATVYSKEREVEKVCIVVITSSRGLCGAFNSNVIKEALRLIEGKYAAAAASGNLTVLCIGKKSYDFFRRRSRDIHLIDEYVFLFNDLSFENTSKASQRLMDAFVNKEFDAVEIAYGRFKNAGTQFPETMQFLPVAKLKRDVNEKQLRADYLFEPSKDVLLEFLVPTTLQIQFHRYLLDTHASEHGARMTAMDKASENADELLGELRLSYNKARQEAITKEILEIVGGAQALSEGS